MPKLDRAAFALIALASILASSALAAPPLPKEQIEAAVKKDASSLEELYKTFHAAPELSLMEKETARRFADELRKSGFTVTEGVGGYGVVGVLENGKGKTLLLRTDLDALPVKEETGAPYASTVQTKDRTGATVNVMHACGHDVHMTCVVGTARALSNLKDQWQGTLVVIGQPAEELGIGARTMLMDGLFTRFPRPDYCLALHVDHELETGKVGYVPGYSHANVDSVDITIRGIGGHGAQPQATKDPIVVAAQVILALQTIASRERHPRDPVVVTVGSIRGGTKHNIIPDDVKLQLTVRTYTDETRKKTLEAIERITKGIAAAAGIPEDLEPNVTVTSEGTPSVYNTPELVMRVADVCRAIVGTDNVVERDPTMGGEDFGRYGRGEKSIPICMYRLGATNPKRVAESKQTGTPLPSLHSSKYLPEIESIRVGTVTMTAAAIDLLRGEK
jgi:hippurate hydrolase